MLIDLKTPAFAWRAIQRALASGWVTPYAERSGVRGYECTQADRLEDDTSIAWRDRAALFPLRYRPPDEIIDSLYFGQPFPEVREGVPNWGQPFTIYTHFLTNGTNICHMRH